MPHCCCLELNPWSLFDSLVSFCSFYSFSTSQWAQSPLMTIYEWARLWTPSPLSTTLSGPTKKMKCERLHLLLLFCCYSYRHLSFKMLFNQPFVFVFVFRFRTPNIRRSILESTPRTPTPFRSTLTLQEAKYGPLKLLVRGLNYTWVLNSLHYLPSSVLQRPQDSLKVVPFPEYHFGAADGRVYQAGANGVCYWAASS